MSLNRAERKGQGPGIRGQGSGARGQGNHSPFPLGKGVRGLGPLPKSQRRPLALDLAIERLEATDLALSDEWLQRVAHAALTAAGITGDVEACLLLADDATLHRLNRDFRHVDRPTDVLSFPQQEGEGPSYTPPPDMVAMHLGDVAISVERARRQAEAYGHALAREVGYLLVHGLLHLVGYDHESDEDQAAMRQVEEGALAAVGLARE